MYLPLLASPHPLNSPAVRIEIHSTSLDEQLWVRAKDEAVRRGVPLAAIVRLGIHKVLDEGFDQAEVDRWDPAFADKAAERRAQRALANLEKRNSGIVEGARTTENSVLRTNG